MPQGTGYWAAISVIPSVVSTSFKVLLFTQTFHTNTHYLSHHKTLTIHITADVTASPCLQFSSQFLYLGGKVVGGHWALLSKKERITHSKNESLTHSKLDHLADQVFKKIRRGGDDATPENAISVMTSSNAARRLTHLEAVTSHDTLGP
jgi:hypothetical protein